MLRGRKFGLSARSVNSGSGKTDPVEFRGGFLTGPFLLIKWAFCKQFSPLRYRIFISSKMTNLSFKRPSPKPHLEQTGSVFAPPKCKLTWRWQSVRCRSPWFWQVKC